MKFSHRLTATVFGILLGISSAPVLGQIESLPRLIGPTVSQHVAQKARAAIATVQARAAQPDLSLVESLAIGHLHRSEKARFVVDLFPGLDLEAEVISAELRPSGGTTVFARLIDIELGSAVFTLESGVLTATVDFPGGSYTITRGLDGNYVVAKQATQLFAPERAPRQVFAPTRSVPDFATAEPDVPVDSGRLIDVMVLWTPAAQTAAGGPWAIQSLAQASVDNANLTYLNSGIAQRLRLVHAASVTYTERYSGCASLGSDEFDCALEHLTGTSDGEMDGVHSLRNTHGADLVSLLIDGAAFCGIAWLPSPPGPWTADQGFSIVDQSCAVGNKSFVHELGHNMGAHHDPYVAPGPGAYAYSHGIVNVAQAWRDVMAYNNQCSDSGVYCNRIQYMSNPKLSYGGMALGDASARNNSHTLNKTAKAIASYRPTANGLHPVPQRFADVATNHPFFGHVEFFAQAGISTGCAAGSYCPNDAVTRRQMAVFLERGMRASNWTPPAATGLFTDVPTNSQFAAFIEALKNDQVTSGCGATTYCPEQAVTRAQMAVFVLRARCGAGYVPNMPASQRFTDVPPSHQFYRYIDKMAAFNITLGCAANLYCPNDAVTRAQMAVFIERAYPFLTPSESCPL